LLLKHLAPVNSSWSYSGGKGEELVEIVTSPARVREMLNRLVLVTSVVALVSLADPGMVVDDMVKFISIVAAIALG